MEIIQKTANIMAYLEDSLSPDASVMLSRYNNSNDPEDSIAKIRLNAGEISGM